jgi:hypothetical protein
MEEAARGLAERTMRWPWWAGFFGSLGAAYLLDGRLTDATRITQDALATGRQWGERGVEGQVLRSFRLAESSRSPGHSREA